MQRWGRYQLWCPRICWSSTGQETDSCVGVFTLSFREPIKTFDIAAHGTGQLVHGTSSAGTASDDLRNG